MHQWEDQTPYKETELQSGYWQAFGERDTIGCHHAVLGEGDLRLCGYKSTPILFNKGERIDLKQYAKESDVELEKYGDDFYLPDCCEFSGELNNYKFKIKMNENMLYLELVCPNKDIWKSSCGFEYGSGFED